MHWLAFLVSQCGKDRMIEDDDNQITLDDFCDRLSGMHTMTVSQLSNSELQIDDGGDEVYIISALSSPGVFSVSQALAIHLRGKANIPISLKPEALT